MDQLTIETDRLKIRNLVIPDLIDFHSYRSDPEVTKYQGFDVFTLEEAKAFILENAEKKFGVAGQWVQYGIELKSTGKLIGDCAIKLNINDIRIGEIGITISPREQNRGYAKESLTSILDFLFNIEGFNRVTEIVDAGNIASIELLKSVGFREEGLFIESIYFKGKWCSEFQYAMLKSEWVLLREDHLK
ncbi:GNAT family N-acetyltransferase [Flavihumibacter rivuli]|uniref:GNAT family N-acetyltransferase n=1 Tax=Flavihumibacter rivuli TaxID=2838156 RepID=UPI001BDE71B3|nr:GNAT family protein [Flavihumibacter rivuli]ULQ55249.1 GNAT family N-acetyltransferase [Flavihumibacter rivuli]